jgi:hypothetical protein
MSISVGHVAHPHALLGTWTLSPGECAVTSRMAEPTAPEVPTRAAGVRLLRAAGEPIQIVDIRLLIVKPGADHIGCALGCQ